MDFSGKTKKNKLPYNRQIAVSRLKSLENKFKKEAEFCQKYQQTIESYLKNGYAVELNTKLYIKLWIFEPSFLLEEPCFEMNNNNIIVQTQESNTQNKDPNSIINNT